MTLVEKAAYLKGLTEGTGIDTKPEGKLWSVLCDLVADMAHTIEDLQESNLDFADAIDGMSEDLNYLEALTSDLDLPEELSDEFSGRSPLYLSDEEEEEPDTEADDNMPLAPISPLFPDGKVELEDEDEDIPYDGIVYDATCPVCGEEFSFDEETLHAGSIKCPNCGEELEFDLEDDEDQ